MFIGLTSRWTKPHLCTWFVASSSLCASTRTIGSPSGASPSASARKRRNARLIPKSPDKILDAPDIVDDYYLNLLDWSPNNILAVALGHSVFLWNATTGATHKLVETTGPGNIVTSLTWGSGNLLAVGTHSAEVRRRSPPFFLFYG